MKIGRKIPSLGRSSAPEDTLDGALDTRKNIERAMRYAQAGGGPHEVMAKQAIKDMLLAVEKAIQGIDSIKEALLSAGQIANTAKSIATGEQIPTLRSDYATQLVKINDIASYCTVNQHNLINGHQTQFTVRLSDQGSSNFLILGTNLTSEGLGLNQAEFAFQSTETLGTALRELARANKTVTQIASTYCANASVLARHYEGL